MSMQSHQFLSGEIARLKAHNDSLRDQLHRYNEFVSALLELEQTAPQADSRAALLGLLRRILLNALSIVDAQDGSLALLDDETAELEFVIVCGDVAADLQGYRIPSDEGVAGWVVTHQRPALVPQARMDERWSGRIDERTGFETRSILAAPLVGDERVLGVVEIVNKRGDEPFDEQDQALIALFCRFAGEALSDVARALPPDMPD